MTMVSAAPIRRAISSAKGAAGDRDHPRAGVGSPAASAARRGSRCRRSRRVWPGAMSARREDVHRAAERLAGKGLAAERRRQGDHRVGIGDVVLGVAVEREGRHAVARARRRPPPRRPHRSTPSPRGRGRPARWDSASTPVPPTASRLEAQTPQPSSRTRTWPGPGVGRGTRSILTRPGPVTTAARIVVGIESIVISFDFPRHRKARPVIFTPGPRSRIQRPARDFSRRMRLRDILFGRRLANREQASRRIGWFQAVPAMGLDGLGSASYGPEAALTVLTPLGLLGLAWIGPVTAAIVVLLAVLYLSYRQTVAAYPDQRRGLHRRQGQPRRLRQPAGGRGADDRLCAERRGRRLRRRRRADLGRAAAAAPRPCRCAWRCWR